MAGKGLKALDLALSDRHGKSESGTEREHFPLVGERSVACHMCLH